MTQTLVLDASAMVAILVGGEAARSVSARIRGAAIHVPAHFDAEVLSALGRLSRAGEIDEAVVTRSLDALERAPFERHLLAPLVAAAWARRGNMRLVDALYVVLADDLSAPIVTLDRGLAAASPHSELHDLMPIKPIAGTRPPSELVSEGRDE